MTSSRRGGLVVAAALAASFGHGGCATTAAPPDPSARAASVATRAPLIVDAKLLPDEVGRVGGVSLRYCLSPDARWPRRLTPENRRALRFLVSAVDDDGRPLHVDADGVRTKDISGCARLVVDVGRMADALADKDMALRAGDDLVVTPDLWLWRAAPDDRPLSGAELLLALESAPFDALLPWDERVDGRHRVDAATFALKCDAAFGRFNVEEIVAGGSRFSIARLDDGRAPAQLSAWIAASAEAVARVGGRYPLPRVNVLAIPTHVTRPVVVGFFSRGGGATAIFFVGEGAPDISDDDINATGRWAITHELAHALLPPVHPADAWFNEGLTTWHQDLLARRVGMIHDDTGYWRELVRGLETGRARAREDGLGLEDASRRMHETAAYQHAYWGGVAIMLLAEVEARKHGASLGDLVGALRARFVEDRPRRAAELLAALDADAGRAGTAARALRATWEAHKAATFPETSLVLDELGVRIDTNGAVVLDDKAPLAAIRRAITSEPGSTASPVSATGGRSGT